MYKNKRMGDDIKNVSYKNKNYKKDNNIVFVLSKLLMVCVFIFITYIIIKGYITFEEMKLRKLEEKYNLQKSLAVNLY